MEAIDEKQKPEQDQKIIIIGINLAVLAAYTIYNSFHRDHDGYIVIGEAFLIAIQIIICLITAIFVCRKEFLLSALVVLLIGFSSCWVVFYN